MSARRWQIQHPSLGTTATSRGFSTCQDKGVPHKGSDASFLSNPTTILRHTQALKVNFCKHRHEPLTSQSRSKEWALM